MHSSRSSEFEYWPPVVTQRRLASALPQTKLTVPRLPNNVLLRSHLLDHLNEGLEAPLILVCAPAGYGKSTLLAQWLKQLERHSQSVAWLSLDVHDNELAVFVHAFGAALQRALPGTLLASANLLYAKQLPPLHDIVTLVLNDLADLPEEIYVVLDDYHLIQSQEVHAFLAELVTGLPYHMHLVIASRTEPPLPLTRWRAQGRVHELHSTDLRFTREETQHFLMSLVGNDLAEQTAGALVERTEGWVAMLRLAALSLHSTSNPADFLDRLDHTLSRDISEYLLEETLAQFSPVTLNVLMRMSLLEPVSAELVAATLGNGQTVKWLQELLDELARSNLFIVRLDRRQQWYRLHHLIKQVLEQRLLAQTSSQEVAELHLRASTWYEQQGLIDEALEHALAARDVARVRQLVESHVLSIYEQEQWAQLERWLHLLSEEQIEGSPFLLIARAWLLQFQGQIKEHQRCLIAAERLLARNGSASSLLDDPWYQLQRGLVAIEWSRIQFDSGQAQESRQSALTALQCIPPEQAYLRSRATEFVAFSSQIAGQDEAAVAVLQQALQDYSGHRNSSIRLLIAQSFIYLLSGKLLQLEQTARHLLSLAQQTRLPAANWFLANVSYERNDLDAAIYHCTVAITNEHYASWRVALDARCLLALSYQAQGLSIRAQQTADTLLAWMREQQNVHLLMNAYAFCAHLALLNGEVEFAQQWLDLAGEQPVGGPMLYFEDPPLTMARLLLARGDEVSVARGQTLLSCILQHVEAIHNVRKIIAVLVLQVWAYELLGRRSEAITTLQQALQLARPGGFIRTFADVPGIAPVLEDLRKRRKAVERGDAKFDAYLQQILIAMISAAGNTPSIEERMRHDGLEPLTERELQILHLLARDFTNKQIARELVVTPGTVKVHTNNLYRKLSVDYRRAAVTLGKALGLLVSNP